ncbi:uncharacterized protein BYT42DRAFT_604257 [Radiomyces spectabilis]|uniref:uncharacterized protein n=1 Tax=Radiomyces spectabilis TaxID=64574 RepID=UPI0022202835|nr:uncharacterized protein BYT42DRAFT_604257 [Radiomyces spectabilis]KAI8381267.1 hypothetical protein BYT42DRAFT_604257 [Radiomyces spectabilis]
MPCQDSTSFVNFKLIGYGGKLTHKAHHTHAQVNAKKTSAKKQRLEWSQCLIYRRKSIFHWALQTELKNRRAAGIEAVYTELAENSGKTGNATDFQNYLRALSRVHDELHRFNRADRHREKRPTPSWMIRPEYLVLPVRDINEDLHHFGKLKSLRRTALMENGKLGCNPGIESSYDASKRLTEDFPGFLQSVDMMPGQMCISFCAPAIAARVDLSVNLLTDVAYDCFADGFYLCRANMVF